MKIMAIWKIFHINIVHLFLCHTILGFKSQHMKIKILEIGHVGVISGPKIVNHTATYDTFCQNGHK